MEFLAPTTWQDALAAKAEYPDAVPVAGGTDVMVGINSGRLRPSALLDLGRVTDLTDWGLDGGYLRLGAAVPYRRIIEELKDKAPGLGMAARTVGSPQIRNRGTIGGNLGTGSPAGDCHPPLLVCDAVIELASVRGVRRIPVTEFFLGPKRTAVAPDELIAAVLVPPADGPQQFAKVGTRNAMVIAVCSFALALTPERGWVRAAIGSAGPVPTRAYTAEQFLTEALQQDGFASRSGRGDVALPESVVRRFGELVAAAASPIDDVRGTAAYRRHALSVLAQRTLRWAWESCRGRGDRCT